jgi:hypothetical protein
LQLLVSEVLKLLISIFKLFVLEFKSLVENKSVGLSSDNFKIGIFFLSLCHLRFDLVPFLSGAIFIGRLDQLAFNGARINLFIEITLVILHPELKVMLPSWFEVHFIALNDLIWYESKVEQDHDHI